MKIFILLISIFLTLFGAWSDGSSDPVDDASEEADDIVNQREFDCWDTWIPDNTPPKQKHEVNDKPDEDGDSNISTKIVNKEFKISLGSIKDNWPNEDDYEKKDKGGDSDHNIKVSVVDFSSGSEGNTISNTITWDPTEDEHIDSDNLKVTKAVRRAKIKFYMCAASDTDNKVEVHSLDSSDCSENASEVCRFEDSAKFVTCYSTDSFAVRPKNFSIEKRDDFLKSASKYEWKVTAINNDNSSSDGYTISSDDYNLNVEQIIKYNPDDTNNSSLYGEATIYEYSFVDGKQTDINMSFNDIGKVQITVRDLNWSDVDSDYTPSDCSNNGNDDNTIGRYICADTNATFIPHHFKVTDVMLHDNNDSTFTYVSNDLNQSASISFHIESLNENNNTTKNFDANSWEHKLKIEFTTDKESKILKHTIFDKIEFEDGNKTISYSEANVSRKLLFNYKRDISKALNPFVVSDVNISVLADYNDINITQSSSEFSESNATFLYARVNTPRHRFKKASSYKVPLFYEIYCKNCNKDLLPNKDDSNTTDDPRWFVNTKHNESFGDSGDITQKYASKVTQDSRDLNYVVLKYDDDLFPYKATMKLNASSWLIYNKYDSNASANEFEIEFEKDQKGNKIGENETNSSTKSFGTTILNRRSLW